MSRESKKELAARLIHMARAREAANDAFDEVVCRKLGVNRTDLRCVNIVQNLGPMPAGRLAQLSGLTTAAVTSVLDRLERAGYARRLRDQADRRQVIVELTPLFLERAERIWGPLANEAFRDMERMSVEQLKLVIAFFALGRELSERHIERVRKLEFD